MTSGLKILCSVQRQHDCYQHKIISFSRPSFIFFSYSNECYDAEEEMSVVGKQLVPTMEHAYAQCKKVHAGYGHSGEFFLLGYRVSSYKGYKQGSAWLMMQTTEVIGL
jgi:hypothetical protein